MQLLDDALELLVVVVMEAEMDAEELAAAVEASVLDVHVEDAEEEEDETVEFAARSRPPVFCCCSRCSLKNQNGELRLVWLSRFLRRTLNTYLVVTPVVSASTMLCDWFWLLFCGLRELRVRCRDLRNSCL